VLCMSRSTLALTPDTTSDNDDITLPGTSLVQITTTGVSTITGFAAPTGGLTDGYVIEIVYFGGSQVTVEHNGTGSTLGNRIYTFTGADVVIANRLRARLVYSTDVAFSIGGWFLLTAEGS